MRTRLWLSQAAVATICFAAFSNLYAFPTDPLRVLVTQQGGITEYGVINNSQTTAQPFDITLFVVATTSLLPNPSTTNPNWIAADLDAVAWTQSMSVSNPNPYRHGSNLRGRLGSRHCPTALSRPTCIS